METGRGNASTSMGVAAGAAVVAWLDANVSSPQTHRLPPTRTSGPGRHPRPIEGRAEPSAHPHSARHARHSNVDHIAHEPRRSEFHEKDT